MGCFDQEVAAKPAAVEERPKAKVVERDAKLYQLMNHDADPIFTSDFVINRRLNHENQTKALVAALPGILTAAFRAGIDAHDIVIEDTQLHGINLKGFQLRGITLERCYLQEADLRQVDFTDANLGGSSFSEARMTHADLTNARLVDANFEAVEARYVQGLLLMGLLNDYWVWGYSRALPDSPGRELRIKAGCRDYSLSEARRHWEGRNGRQEIFASLHLMEAMAQERGWLVASPARAGADDEDDE